MECLRLFILSLFVWHGALAAPYCADVFTPPVVPVVEKVSISGSEFHTSTKALRDTLSGKLATVWRSEWKTKLSFQESNQYVADLVNTLLTPQTRAAVMQSLDVTKEGFVQQIHSRLFQLQTENKIQDQDDLGVRDRPAPNAAKDTTFTYYTKPLASTDSDGKHQVRIRNYLREVFYDQMALGQAINGFDAQGNAIEISRIDDKTYQIAGKKLSLDHMNARYGLSFLMFAPHGKSFKLEIKTALEDEISDTKYPLLAGQHMVQKLDASLTPAQVSRLFAPLESFSPQQRTRTSLLRIDHVVKELIAKTPENRSRIEAVFNVLKNGVEKNPDFLKIEGATFYHRSAFESKSGFQTTIDRDQGVFAGNMYYQHSLKNPISVIRNNSMISPLVEDARHVELKIPVTSLQNTAGIRFQDPQSAPSPQNPENDVQLNKATKIYHGYVQNNNHAGKFNFIRKNGYVEIDD